MCDVFVAAGGGEQWSSRVLNKLKCIEDVVGRATEEEDAVGCEAGGCEGRRRTSVAEHTEGRRGKRAALLMWLAWGRKERVGSKGDTEIEVKEDEEGEE